MKNEEDLLWCVHVWFVNENILIESSPTSDTGQDPQQEFDDE